MDQSPLIAVPESALARLIQCAHACGTDSAKGAALEAAERIRAFHKGQEEMYEDHAREHLVPEPVTTRAVAFDPAPYLEEAKRLGSDDE